MFIQKMNNRKLDKPFMTEDVESSLEGYDVQFVRFPIDNISKFFGIDTKKNKRNSRTQEKHLQETKDI